MTARRVSGVEYKVPENLIWSQAVSASIVEMEMDKMLQYLLFALVWNWFVLKSDGVLMK